MPPTTSTNGFILAGGQSRRMGGQSDAGVGRQISARPHDPVTFDGCESGTGCRAARISRPYPGKGPLGGILTALESSEQQSSLFLAVDLPLFDTWLSPCVPLPLHGFQETTSRLPNRRGISLCLGVRKDLTPEVERRVVSQNLSIRAFVQESQVEILEETNCGGWASEWKCLLTW